MKKAERRRFNDLFKKMDDLFKDCSVRTDVNYRTIRMEAFEWYLGEYLRLFEETEKVIQQSSDAKTREWAQKGFKSYYEKMRELLISHLLRILYPMDNLSISAKNTSEIEETVKKVEDEFDQEVQKAIDYFGDSFLEAKLDVPNTVFYQDCPKTIQEMLNAEERYDWRAHEFRAGGLPKPLYREMYVMSLRGIIDSYITQFEKEEVDKT